MNGFDTQQAYADRYAQVLHGLPGLIDRVRESGRLPALGLTSNLDIVLRWDADRYNKILEKTRTAVPSSRVGEVMRTAEDFARISADYMMRGLGGNFDIGTRELCDYLRSVFDTELALGGTCAQGAAALGALGIPVNVHISDHSREVCRLMDYPGLTAVREGRRVPLREAASDDPPVCHFILQYRRGDVIRLGGESFEIPESNRLILFYDEMQKDPPFREEFFSYWKNAPLPPTSVLLSGFDAIVDEAVAEKKLDVLTEFLRELSARRPRPFSYFEGAFYMNPAVKTRFMQRLGPLTDIVGMNEEELAAHAQALGGKPDLSRLDGICAALELLFRAYGLRGVVLHSRDYALYYGNPLEGAAIEDGLIMGSLMAATRARTGHYGSPSELEESQLIPLSKTGIALAREAQVRDAQIREARGEKTGTRCLKVVPARTLDDPKYTVGLGDTFVAGVHTCFMNS